MVKNREETEKRILNSVGRVLIEDGANLLGINTIARKAGVSKVLIYRYFGSYDDLILKYIKMNNPFPELKNKTLDYINRGSINYRDAFSYFFESLVDYIYENPAFKEILTYELSCSNVITKEIALERERASIEILKIVEEKFPEINFDIASVTAVITGGVFYLCQRSKFISEFNTINFDNSSLSIKNAVNNLINLL